MTRNQAGVVLGVDAATPRGSIALVSSGAAVSEIGFDGPDSPSRHLLPLIRLALARADLSLADLSGIAVTVGPGSFTGIRVGLATVRGLAMATGCPVTGVSTLLATARAAARGAGRIAAWLDAGRGEVYAGLFAVTASDRVEPVGGEAAEVVAPPEVVLAALPGDPIRFVGAGAIRHGDRIARRPHGSPQDILEPAVPFLAAAVARLGAEALASGSPRPTLPRYLRPPEALKGRA